tara:strand:- start:1483 stop:1860 length:378 start_codon:yes stop_codon:yes gene_type:complete
MTDDRVQINKEIILELSAYMRNIFPGVESSDYHRGSYVFDDIYAQYIAFLNNNIKITFNNHIDDTIVIDTYYDEITDGHYLPREDYIKFTTFLDKTCVRSEYPSWSKIIELCQQLVGTPLVKASR